FFDDGHRGRAHAPALHKDPGAEQAKDEQRGGHDPGDDVELREHGRGEGGGTVFVLEGGEDDVVRVAVVDGGAEFGEHAIGIGAADVVALDEDLGAAADAHQLVAEIL